MYSTEVISISVLKGIFLIEKGECRRNLFSFHGNRLTLVCGLFYFPVSLGTHQQELLHRDTILCGVWFPFLTFIIEITTNKFNPSPFYKDYKHRIPIHNRIKELMDEGLGYKRIHKILVKEGFEVGKSPNCVNSMIKKILKRE